MFSEPVDSHTLANNIEAKREIAAVLLWNLVPESYELWDRFASFDHSNAPLVRISTHEPELSPFEARRFAPSASG
jgi:hypothetical protein